MEKQKAIDLIDKMIEEVPKSLNDLKEIWVSGDIYRALRLTEYKEYKIKTSLLMPKEYAVIGSKFF
jgi:hypothetical protein